MKLAALILLLNLYLPLWADAQPLSAPVIRANIFTSTGASKLPVEMSSLPGSCTAGSSVLLNVAGTVGTVLYICDDRGGGLEWWPSGPSTRFVAMVAGAWEVDGSICQEPAVLSLGGSPQRFVQCLTQSTSGIITMSIGLDAIEPGTPINFWLTGVSTAGSPSGSIDFNVSSKCENPVNGAATVSLGATQALALAFDTQNQWETSLDGVALALTPGGTCGALSRVTVKLQMTTAAGQSDTALANAFLVQGLISYTIPN